MRFALVYNSALIQDRAMLARVDTHACTRMRTYTHTHICVDKCMAYIHANSLAGCGAMKVAQMYLVTLVIAAW
jgi:hypothetical protein